MPDPTGSQVAQAWLLRMKNQQSNQAAGVPLWLQKAQQFKAQRLAQQAAPKWLQQMHQPAAPAANHIPYPGLSNVIGGGQATAVTQGLQMPGFMDKTYQYPQVIPTYHTPQMSNYTGTPKTAYPAGMIPGQSVDFWRQNMDNPFYMMPKYESVPPLPKEVAQGYQTPYGGGGGGYGSGGGGYMPPQTYMPGWYTRLLSWNVNRG